MYTIRVYSEGGADSVGRDLTDDVFHFEFDDAQKKADKLQIKVDNFDLRYFDDPIFRKGNLIEFTFGYPGRLSPPRRCVIQKVSGGRELTIEAHGLAMLMHKIPRQRTWENLRLSEIATRIAKEYGTSIAPTQDGADKDNIFIEKELDIKVSHLHQAGQTDAAFLSRLARRHGLDFYVDSRGMHFKRTNMKQPPVTAYTWYNGEGDFMDFSIDNDITGKKGAVTLKGFDPLKKKSLSHRADNDSAKRDGLAPVIEIIDPRTGVHSLQHRQAEESIEHTSESSVSAVKAHAEAKYRGNQEVTVLLGFKVLGDPDLQGKRVVSFLGLGKRVSGLYKLFEVKHTINSSGYLTSGKAKTDGHGGYGKVNNVASKASLNKGDGEKKQEIQIFDPRTGESHIEFKSSKHE